MTHGAGLAIIAACAIAGCAADRSGDYVDPRLSQFCRQQGYAPGSEPFQQCLMRYSRAGRGQELDWGAAGLDTID